MHIRLNVSRTLCINLWPQRWVKSLLTMEKRFWKYFKNSSKYIYLNLFNNLKFFKKKKFKDDKSCMVGIHAALSWMVSNFLEWFTDIEYSHKI